MARVAEQIQSSPIAVDKSVRSEEIRALTSCRAGKIIPLTFIPILREDRVSVGRLRVSVDMAETMHTLLNAVNLTVYAHFISHAALERFAGGLDSLNRSYQGIPEPATGTVIPWVQTVAFNKDNELWKTLGVHWPPGGLINDALLEAYNILVNFRRRARSDKLPVRTRIDGALAAGFWKNTNLSYIVPDWDQAALDGEVELEFATEKLYIQGIGRIGTPTTYPNLAVTEVGPDGTSRSRTYANALIPADTTSNLRIESGSSGNPWLTAALNEAGVSLSLSNIELAKQTAAFAKLRERFDGIEDDYLIDLLMEGIRIPDEALTQPILLDRKSTIFGYSERHAMDGANLDQSVTTGKTVVDLTFRTPPMNAGGVILITAEIVPEQLYERQWDAYLGTSDPALLPNFMRDFLDPEKVQAVTNNFVDVLHDTPVSLFGYAPLNHAWKRSLTRAGGKFYRPDPNVFVEDRQRFWSVEVENPTLTKDFYLVTNPLPHSVFADTLSDAFEILTVGRVEIVGNTVFGAGLSEDTDAYEKIMDQVDTDRIVIAPIPVADAPGGEAGQ